MTSLRFIRQTFAPVLMGALLGSVAAASAQGPKSRPSPAAKTTPAPSPSAAPYALPEVVATVDGDPIKKEDLERVARAVAGSKGRTLQDLTPSQQRETYQSLLDTMIVDKLVSKEAAGEQVSDIDVEKRFNDLMKQYPNPKAFDDEAKKYGDTPEKVKANIRGQLAQQQWLEKQMAADAKVSPQEVEKFYRESPVDRFSEPEVIHVRHLLVAVRKNATPENALKAEDRAKALLAQVKKDNGQTFAELARKSSDDPSARDLPAKDGAPARAGNGGDLGWFTRDRIMPEFGEVAFRLQPNEIGGPVRTQFGYHVIQLLEHKPAHTATLDESRDQIAAYLQSEKRQAAMAQLMANLRTKAKIQTFLP